MDEIKQNDDIILMIDEVHTLIGAGAAEGAIDAANILKPALARGELQCIGATTLDEYRKHIEKDPALERRFQPVLVPEPTVEETYEILTGLRERYEAHHKLRYTDDALMAAAKFSSQYISDRFLPDKAIDLIDEAGSRVRLRHIQLPEEARDLDKELKQVRGGFRAASVLGMGVVKGEGGEGRGEGVARLSRCGAASLEGQLARRACRTKVSAGQQAAGAALASLPPPALTYCLLSACAVVTAVNAPQLKPSKLWAHH